MNWHRPGRQVRSLTLFYNVCFSQSRIGVNKCIFNKHTIKVCVSCCWRCQDIIKNKLRKPWLCVCWKLSFLRWSLIVKSKQKRIELLARPGFDPAMLIKTIPWWIKKLDYSMHPSGPSDHLPSKAVIEFFIHHGLKTYKPVDRPSIFCCYFFPRQPERKVAWSLVISFVKRRKE